MYGHVIAEFSRMDRMSKGRTIRKLMGRGGGGGGQIRCIMGDVQVANCSRVRKRVTFGAVRSRRDRVRSCYLPFSVL